MFEKFFKVQLLKADKVSVRRILRRWPTAAKREYQPDWVAGDIVNRVVNRIEGSKYYQRGKNPKAFKLVVSEKEAFLSDLERHIIYAFQTMGYETNE
ncbi:MAG: hypothetical protein E7269_08090 [Lachnospiraceae bacterium]|nr:hypothetical protein [Lachnospiraceae bacterium]